MIKVDLRGTVDLSELPYENSNFRDVEITGGTIIRDTSGNVVTDDGSPFSRRGVFFVAPNITQLATYPSPAPTGPNVLTGTFVADLVRQNGERDTDVGVIRIDVPDQSPAYTAIMLDGSVGDGGDNNPLDVARVQQRLRFLNFRAKKTSEFGPSPEVTVDGRVGDGTIQAIRLFQAATVNPDGKGKPDSQTGVIGNSDVYLKWLNAGNAPYWVQAPREILGSDINGEFWSTSWSLDIISSAINTESSISGHITSLTEYPDVAWPSGHSAHAEHKAGLSIDVGFAGNPPPNTQQLLPTPLSPEGMLAALTAREREVVNQIRAIATAAGGEYVTTLLGNTAGGRTFPRIHQVLQAFGVSSTLATSGHEDHFHVRLRPAVDPPGDSSSSITSSYSGFGADPRMYYRFTIGSGLILAGRSNATGNFSEVLTPNSAYTLAVYQPSTNRSGVFAGATNASGFTTDLGSIILDQFGGPDADGDGIPDIGEFAIGTDPNSADSDGDGITDAAEITQGTNPLDGVGFPTGVISSLPMPGPAEAVAVSGDLVFVATGSHGLAIIDGKKFDQPIILGQIDLNGTATDVGVDAARNLAVVSTGLALQIVDVSDPMLPKLARTVSASATFVEVVDGFAYAAGGTTLSVIDLTSGDILQRLTLPGSGSVTGFAREGSRLYAYVSGSDTLAVVDITKPDQPVLLGQRVVSVASTNVGLFAGNDTVYLAGSGVRAVDVSNPANPQIVGQPVGGNDFFTARRVALNGSGLALVTPDGGNTLSLYDASDRTKTGANRFLTSFTLSGAAKDVAVSRGIGYVAVGNRLEVVNYRPFDTAGIAPTNVVLTAQAADLDPATPGLQVLEGSRIAVRVAAQDDVQVRSVEFLVNGQVVQTDVAFPFDAVFTAPTITAGGTTLRIQARVTDTGGNATLSNEVVVDVGPDIFPPVLESTTPVEGALIREGQRTLRVRFNEAVDATRLVGTGAVRVVGAGADGAFGTADDTAAAITVDARDGGRLFQIATDYLSPGKYRLLVGKAEVVDLAGNAAGTGDFAVNFTVGQTAARLVGNPPTVAFVIDLSGSTASGLGSTGIGDRNGDGSANTILDAEIAGFEVLNQELINLGFGSTAQIAIITFTDGAANLDMDPVAAGVQLVTSPLADANGNGVRDVEELLRTLRASGGTNFEAPYQRVVSTFATAAVPDGTGNVIFISDGSGGSGFTDEVAALKAQGHGIVAFGAGAGAQLNLLQQMDPQAARFSTTDELLDLFVQITAQ